MINNINWFDMRKKFLILFIASLGFGDELENLIQSCEAGDSRACVKVGEYFYLQSNRNFSDEKALVFS